MKEIKHKKRYIENRLPIEKKSRFSVKQLVKEHGFDKSCICCKSNLNLTLDHIIPKSKHGHDRIDNLQILCLDCNQFKADREMTIDELQKRILRFYKKKRNEINQQFHDILNKIDSLEEIKNNKL